jgi:hypothetical protein
MPLGVANTMRRFLFTFTLFSVPGWSQQPAQQPAQPATLPIVVKVEMPPTPRRDLLGYFQALGPLIAAATKTRREIRRRHTAESFDALLVGWNMRCFRQFLQSYRLMAEETLDRCIRTSEALRGMDHWYERNRLCPVLVPKLID